MTPLLFTIIRKFVPKFCWLQPWVWVQMDWNNPIFGIMNFDPFQSRNYRSNRLAFPNRESSRRHSKIGGRWLNRTISAWASIRSISIIRTFHWNWWLSCGYLPHCLPNGRCINPSCQGTRFTHRPGPNTWVSSHWNWLWGLELHQRCF